MQTTQTNIDDSTESAEGSLLEGLVLELGMGATTPEVDLASATAPLSDETLDARAERLLTQNRGLVIWFANRYARDAQEREDLIAEGMLGALRAARRFDPSGRRGRYSPPPRLLAAGCGFQRAGRDADYDRREPRHQHR